MQARLYNGLVRTGAQSPELVLEALLTDRELAEAVGSMFKARQFSAAVETAFKFIGSLVRQRTGLDLDGAPLMWRVFSPKQPILRFNSMETVSDCDEQRGYMEILAGCMMALRNPRAHGYENRDSDLQALSMFLWANHLVERIRDAKLMPASWPAERD